MVFNKFYHKIYVIKLLPNTPPPFKSPCTHKSTRECPRRGEDPFVNGMLPLPAKIEMAGTRRWPHGADGPAQGGARDAPAMDGREAAAGGRRIPESRHLVRTTLAENSPLFSPYQEITHPPGVAMLKETNGFRKMITSPKKDGLKLL